MAIAGLWDRVDAADELARDSEEIPGDDRDAPSDLYTTSNEL